MNTLFQDFQEFRKILCICPCCDEIVRVSDLRIKARGPIVKTWLDSYEQKTIVQENKEEKFEQLEEKIRERNREVGRREAGKKIKGMLPQAISKMKINLSELIPIMHPVDFVLFQGMNEKKSISKISFISRTSKSPITQDLRNQVKNAVEHRKYSWQVGRIDDRGEIKLE